MKSIIGRARAAVIGLATLLVLAFGMTVTGCDASDGDRVGVVTKFSNKGVIKSWEGEMVIGGFSNGGANTWAFHVPDGPLVAKVQAALDSGKRVKIHYTQLRVTPPTQNSDYDVTSVSAMPDGQ
jgi:hypothetical protein